MEERGEVFNGWAPHIVIGGVKRKSTQKFSPVLDVPKFQSQLQPQTVFKMPNSSLNCRNWWFSLSHLFYFLGTYFNAIWKRSEMPNCIGPIVSAPIANGKEEMCMCHNNFGLSLKALQFDSSRGLLLSEDRRIWEGLLSSHTHLLSLNSQYLTWWDEYWTDFMRSRMIMITQNFQIKKGKISAN